VREEGFQFGRAHLSRVTLAVEQDEALAPIDVDLLGADGEVAQADLIAKRVEQARRPFGC